MPTSITGQGISIYPAPDDALSSTSKRPVQNKVIDEELSDVKNAISQNEASLATVETTSTASQGYDVDDLLVYQNRLYKVTSQIAAGGTLTIGTNIVATTVEAEIANGGSSADLTTVNFGDLPMAVNRLLFGTPSDISGRNLKVKTYYNAVDIYERTGSALTANIVLTGTPRILGSTSRDPWFDPIDSDFSAINMDLLRSVISAYSPTNSKWWGFYKDRTANIGNGCYITMLARYQKSNEEIETRYVSIISGSKQCTYAQFLDLINNPITVEDETLYCNAICIALRVYLSSVGYMGFDLLNK